MLVVHTHKLEKPLFHKVDAHRLEVSSYFDVEAPSHQGSLELNLDIIGCVRVCLENQSFQMSWVLLIRAKSSFWQFTVAVNFMTVISDYYFWFLT